MEIRDLRLVKAIAEHGSLVRAARVLGVAQPALTRSLAAIEARLRGRLFERTRRGVVLTDLGRAVMADGADILQRVERLGERLEAVRGDQVRDLRVLAGPFVGESVGVAAVARMVARHPAVRMRMLTSNWAEIPRAILEREASIGLLSLQDLEDDPNLVVEPLRPQPGVFLVRHGHPLARRRAITLADILGFPLVFIGRVPREVQGPMAEARHAARKGGDAHAAYPALVIESPTVSIAALAHSDTITAVPVPIAARALRGKDVVALRWRRPWMTLRPGILTRRGARLDEVERDFLSQLRDADAEAAEQSAAWCRRNRIPADT
jgi:DNA-binding transcriptional LysR family regulator